MYAVVFEVDFKADWSGDPDLELDQLTGFIRSAPGFVRGTWTSDGQRGLSFILFEPRPLPVPSRTTRTCLTTPPGPSAPHLSTQWHGTCRPP